MPPEARLGQHDAGRRLGDIGRGGHRNSHLRLTEGRCVVGAVAAHADSMAALLERLDEVVFCLGKNAGEDSEIRGTYTVGNWSRRRDVSIQAYRAGYDLCGRWSIACQHHGADSEGVQLRDERSRIRSRRIAQRNDPGDLQSVRRAHRDGQHPEAPRLKLVRRRGRIGRRLREIRDCREGSLHGAYRGAAGIHSRGLRHLCGGIERHKFAQFRQIGRNLFCGGGPDGGVNRILPAVRTGQGSPSQNMRLIEAGHGMNGGYGQLVLRQRAGLVRAQHVDACRFVDCGEPGRKDAQIVPEPARRAPPQE